MYSHFEFKNGGNPYITFKNKGLFDMIKTYNIEIIGKQFYRVSDRRKKPKNISNYEFIKGVLRDFIIECSLLFSEYSFFQSELIEWACFFETYGKKYGLTKELKENGLI